MASRTGEGERADRGVRPTAAASPDLRFPGTVHLGVVAQHRAIEGLLTRIDEVLRQSDFGEPFTSFAMQELTRLTAELSAELRAHLAYENHHLLPLIRETGLHGVERAVRIEAEHVEQRDRIDDLMQQICTLSTPDRRLVHSIREFVDNLRVDMRQEERGLRDENLRRGEVIAICGWPA